MILKKVVIVIFILFSSPLFLYLVFEAPSIKIKKILKTQTGQKIFKFCGSKMTFLLDCLCLLCVSGALIHFLISIIQALDLKVSKGLNSIWLILKITLMTQKVQVQYHCFSKSNNYSSLVDHLMKQIYFILGYIAYESYDCSFL